MLNRTGTLLRQPPKESERESNHTHTTIRSTRRDRSTVINTVQVMRDRISVIDREATDFSVLRAKIQSLPDLPTAVTARVHAGRRVSEFWSPTRIAKIGYMTL